ncbi:MAG: mannose-1-phosphate guanylyltransferase [Paludibacteraceae bacterium]|nr:mannose-1-phosphate guanylyltransferase [Paludibacteraceae bacterium]MBO5862795.1 mannose-1-phosphate guanylyltransferase [Paludibacteraceae bacterium]MBO5987974.1 mannose-1-phosphate guanylyltransferase [Paludibacteraceae bacterium]
MKNNFCVIMAGGVGSRFWPFSTNERPKQFLDLFGTGRTLLQMTFDRFKRIMPVENIYIASNTLYKDLILEQLPEITENQVLLEPARRNTAPCICYAVNKIMALNENANIVVSPSDHLILKEDEFVEIVKRGLNFTENNDCLLTLGIKPSRPETGYGYIQVDGNDGKKDFYKVKTFTEKPNLELAKVFLESGEFLWNSGMFLWNGKTISEAFDLYAIEMSNKFKSGKEFYNTDKEQDFINNIYQSCTNLSIDYAILEKAKNVHVIAAEFGWSDLGTWGSLYELSNKDENNNVTLKGKSLLYESKNNIIAIPEGKLAVVQGLDDYIIAQADNALLICQKSEEQRIRQFVNDTKVKIGEEYI